jgi:hypothetical protein
LGYVLAIADSGCDPFRRTNEMLCPLSFFGHIVFRVEDGLVVNRMPWPLADELRRQADVECSGPEHPDATEILNLMRGDLSLLNEARVAVMGSPWG